MTIAPEAPLTPLAPGFLELEITRRCQLTCAAHCYAESGPTQGHGTMTGDDWKRVITEAADLGVKKIQLIGGEPTLHPDFTELVEHALAHGLKVQVYSNLYRVRPEHWALFARPGVTLATSYYADTDAGHDQVTGRNGSHAATRANLIEAHQRGIPVQVGIVDVLDGQRVEEARAELMALGITEVHIDRVRGVGNATKGIGLPSTSELCGRCALDCVLQCETRILVIDDLHFLKWHDRNGTEVSNHFKYIANEFPVTIIFIGVELADRGLYSEANSRGNITLAQTARRTTPLTMEPFTVTNDQRRREWRRMLLALEQRIVLCRKFPGMLADELSDYLYIRTSGHIGSLMTLINRGCQRATRTGVELLDADLLDQVKLDAGAEGARKALAKKFARGRMTSKPRSRATKTKTAA